MHPIQKSISFLSHWISAQTRYGVHSPFVYQFVTRVLPHVNSPEGEQFENFRRSLLRNKEVIEIEDLGAGYGGKPNPVVHKALNEVVKSSARGRREGELLRRIVSWLEPTHILELGSNLGFSGMYLRSGRPEAAFSSVEGSAGLARLAKANHLKFGFDSRIRHESFEAFLDSPAFDSEVYDLVFMDGNHRYAPTMNYFEKLLPRVRRGGVIMLDDINWSEGMQKAWKEIKENPAVNLSVDLYFFGLAFIDRPQAEEHFKFRFRPF